MAIIIKSRQTRFFFCIHVSRYVATWCFNRDPSDSLQGETSSWAAQMNGWQLIIHHPAARLNALKGHAHAVYLRTGKNEYSTGHACKRTRAITRNTHLCGLARTSSKSMRARSQHAMTTNFQDAFFAMCFNTGVNRSLFTNHFVSVRGTLQYLMIKLRHYIRNTKYKRKDKKKE